MTNTAHPILCGGTFFIQILESKRTTATRRQRTQSVFDAFHEQDVLLGLVKIVQPDYLKPAGDTFKTYTTYFKRCAENTPQDLQFADEAVVSAFLSRLESNYDSVLNDMTGFVNNFIEVGTTSQKDKKLARRLIEMIVNDAGTPAIPDDYQFKISRDGSSVVKSELATVPNIYLPAFLLSIWKFIVMERKNNSMGATTVAAWSAPNVKGRYSVPESSSTPEDFTVDCGTYVSPALPAVDAEFSEELTPANAQRLITPDVYTYLRNAEEKYSTMKTLLYNDEPKKFYSFYVCNRIRFRGPDSNVEGQPTYPLNMQFIDDATIDKIRKVSRFAIIIGTGGLGKSMMMRHLMLNAIANFDDMKCFPVFVPLKDFDESADSLLEYVYSKIGVFDDSLSKEQFELMLTHGLCLLLLDGLDEIGAGSVKRFERELEALTDKYSGNMFILSSRPFQSFVSYERFSLLRLMPFNPRQAMQLVDRLEFRPDEPAIKVKFLAALEKTLFRTHRSFTENPLLLTIMLLTFEQYAEVPVKMHVFYREAFEVLAKRHDASKGAYKRALRTGLSVDAFADYFAELCFRSYNDEKFEMTAEEFDGYFHQLKARTVANDKKTTASDFREDLCSNLCLMFFEGNSYHFTHRSFQEYFCALFFSKQKDKFIAKLGDFFEKHQRRMFGDRTFYMLYDMVTEKVEEYIFLPFLTSLLDECNKADGYWTFLEAMYPQITYSSEDEYRFTRRAAEPRSFLLSAILNISGFNGSGGVAKDIITLAELPYYEDLEIERIPRYKQVAYVTSHGDEEIEEIEDKDAGYICQFAVSEIRQQPENFEDLLTELNNDKFVFKKQYHAIQQYMKELAAKQKSEDNTLFDLLEFNE